MNRGAKGLLLGTALVFSFAFAAELVGLELGPPAPGFDPSDLKTYRLAEKRRVFGPGDRAVLFVLRWRFEEEDVGPLPIELYLIPPKGTLVRIGYTLNVPPAWVGRTISTYAYLRLTPERVRLYAGRWTVYVLANGELKGTGLFELRPDR